MHICLECFGMILGMSSTILHEQEDSDSKRAVWLIIRKQKALNELRFFHHIHIKKEIGKMKTLESFGMQINVC